MDLNKLEEEIDHRVSSNAHLVLLEAREKVGPCSYATNIGTYVRARVLLSRLYDLWGHGWSYYGCDLSGLEKMAQKEKVLLELLATSHQSMYSQPCLLCSVGQQRKKLWQTAPFSPFGTPLTQRSQAQVQRSASLPSIISSMPSRSDEPTSSSPLSPPTEN